jgi:hypothetical protein
MKIFKLKILTTTTTTPWGSYYIGYVSVVVACANDVFFICSFILIDINLVVLSWWNDVFLLVTTGGNNTNNNNKPTTA